MDVALTFARPPLLKNPIEHYFILLREKSVRPLRLLNGLLTEYLLQRIIGCLLKYLKVNQMSSEKKLVVLVQGI
jgi:hypothetical protein